MEYISTGSDGRENLCMGVPPMFSFPICCQGHRVCWQIGDGRWKMEALHLIRSATTLTRSRPLTRPSRAFASGEFLSPLPKWLKSPQRGEGKNMRTLFRLNPRHLRNPRFVLPVL